MTTKTTKKTELATINVKIVTGCIENLMFNDHARAKNWVATVTMDKTQPGGLARKFWAKGTAGWVEIPADFELGMVIEFAGDYYSGSGRKDARRSYARLVGAQVDHLVLTEPVEEYGDVPKVKVEKIKVEKKATPKKDAKPASKPATAGNGTRQTRAKVFAQIMREGSALSKVEMCEAVEERYAGSTNETRFWVNAYVALLVECGVLDVEEDGRYVWILEEEGEDELDNFKLDS
jgi:hypothetical protein